MKQSPSGLGRLVSASIAILAGIDWELSGTDVEGVLKQLAPVLANAADAPQPSPSPAGTNARP